MIRTNLATRPFYNEGAVRLGLLGLAILALAASAFNGTRIVQLSRRDTTLAMQATRDETQAADLVQRAARQRATVDPRIIDAAAADARQANELIDRRTFSWTGLFNQLETTLPADVRIATVRPKLDPKRGIVLTIIVFAKTVEDVNLFIDNLDATGAVRELEKLGEQLTEENELEATIETVYAPASSRVAAGGNAR